MKKNVSGTLCYEAFFIAVLLVYISGYNTDSEIKISGINADFNDEEG